VVVETIEKETAINDDRFPMRGIQQRWIKVWSLLISIMVDNGDPQAAADQLYEYADMLEAALMEDGTLGGRVPFVSPFYNFDFQSPFVEYPDGTRGRAMDMTLLVGELVEAPE